MSRPLVYAALLICALAAPTFTPLLWDALGYLALLLLAYVVFAEWGLWRRRATSCP